MEHIYINKRTGATVRTACPCAGAEWEEQRKTTAAKPEPKPTAPRRKRNSKK